jgi:hypothetical protein
MARGYRRRAGAASCGAPHSIGQDGVELAEAFLGMHLKTKAATAVLR